MKTPTLALASLASLAMILPRMPAAERSTTVQLKTLDDRVRIEIGGALFTEYIFGGAPKPYLYPILAADGTKLNRDFPMAEVPGEARDHPHHRSLWFAHGIVNGHDFWLENDRAGKIEHDRIVEAKSGAIGLLRTRSRWVARDGTVVCTDERTIRAQAMPGGRLLDFDITLHASHGALTLGDTKEGTMAIRVAQWMVMPHKVRNEEVPGNGHAVNSDGLRDNAAWGKRAAWVDYFAPHEGKTYGIAIFDHPKNPRHPTWWHVRDYGLFAANPFGQHDFENLRDRPNVGDFTIPEGGNATFRYRIYFHEGDPDAARVDDHYRDYAAER